MTAPDSNTGPEPTGGPRPAVDSDPTAAQALLSAHPDVLVDVSSWPELATLLTGRRVRVAQELGQPFVLDGSAIVISDDVLTSRLSTAATLREAVERATLLEHCAPTDESAAWARAIVARHAAIGYMTTFPDDEVRRIDDQDPTGYDNYLTVRRLGETGSDPARAAAVISQFLADRDGTPPPADLESAGIELAARALPLAVPTEVLFTRGGDDRLFVDPATGTNKYGCSPRPRPWALAFSSCTGSSPTVLALTAGERMRQRLLAAALAGRLEEETAAETDRIRAGIRAVLGVAPELPVEVILTPSGTDAELLPTLIASLGGRRRLTNIVVAPQEIGNGSLPAAGGRHFSRTAPSGDLVSKGTHLDGFPADAVELQTIAVRDQAGAVIDAEVFDAQLRELVGTAVAGGQHVLLHLVEGAKTGIRLPSRDTVAELQSEYGDRISVVVDAAQMRVDQATAIGHLDSGAMVIVTGSKFYAGPPFSGALLVPSDVQELADQVQSWPVGLGAYFRANEITPRFAALRRVAKPGSNLGLLLRWEAALAEMGAFHSVTTEVRDEILRGLATGVLSLIEQHPEVELVPSPYTSLDDPAAIGLDELPTIISFSLTVRSEGGPQTLEYEHARTAYHLLHLDISGTLPKTATARQRWVAAQIAHIGQPVKIGRRGDGWGAALRIAFGAPTLSRIIADYTRGRSWRDRLDCELRDVSLVLEKASLIARHWTHLQSAIASAP